MAIFSFTDTSGKSFDVKGPDGLSLEQAKQIFDKQSSSGSLVGLKPGDTLSALSQAKAGLSSAIAQVGQTISGITGALGGGIASAAGAIGSAATGAFASAKSMADKALNLVTGSKSGAVTDGINTADFAKQATALAPVAGMNVSQVTGVLAQAKNLVGQAADKMTDSKGAGSFGFDAKQLETAGILKPGMSKYVESGASTLTSLLKSPSVFTGKDGIKSSGDLLSSPSAQSSIQQDLMAKGSAGLAAIGTSLKNFNPADSAGLALNAAKSLPNTEALIKGLPLPTDLKNTMTSTIKAGAYAVNLVTTKIPAEFKAETTPAPAADTTNRETLNAASNRVIGNPKIPTPNYTTSPADDIFKSKTLELNSTLDQQFDKLADLGRQAIALNEKQTITQAEYDQLLATREAYRAFGREITQPMYLAYIEYFGSLSDSDQKGRASIFNALRARIASIGDLRDKIYKLIEELANKIA